MVKQFILRLSSTSSGKELKILIEGVKINNPSENYIEIEGVGLHNGVAGASALDRNISNIYWSSDDKRIYFQFDDKGITKIGSTTLEGKFQTEVDQIIIFSTPELILWIIYFTRIRIHYGLLI